MTSKLFRLNWQDLWKAFVVAFFTALVTSLGDIIESGSFPHSIKEWWLFLKVPLFAAIAYLIKNFFTKGDTPSLTDDTYTIWYLPANRTALEALCPFLNFPGEQYEQYFIIIQELNSTQVSQVEAAQAAGKVAGFKPGSHPHQPPA